MNNINVDNANTTELKNFYNAHAEKPVSKFTNLATARRRVTALIESMEISAAAHATADQAGDAAKAARKTAKVAKKAAETVDANLPVAIKSAEDAAPDAPVVEATKVGEKVSEAKPGYDVVKAAFGEAIVAKVRRSNAAGIAASWNDAEVRDARLTRQGVTVTVNGKSSQYPSTQAAFEALGLPVSKVIRFRMKLKAANKLTYTHAGKSYEFSIL